MPDEAFKIQPEFSKEFVIETIDFLDTNRHILLNKNNDLIGGLQTEFYRISSVYGGKEALVIQLVMLALSDYYDYFEYELGFEETSDKKELLYKTKMDKYIEQMCELRRKIVSSNTEDLCNYANSLLVELGIESRNYGLKYGNNPYKGKAIEQRIELPESTKKKLSEAIAKSLNKDLK